MSQPTEKDLDALLHAERLHPFQRTGALFLAANQAALLADHPGTGKSVQALKAAELVNASRILILCPAAGASSWPQQIAEWQGFQSVTIRWNTETDRIGLPSGPLNVIVTYDQLVHHRDKLIFSVRRSARFDCVIIDECHYLKNRTAQRTKAVYGGRLDITAKSSLLHYVEEDAPVWVLSGTPWPNDFSEFFTHAIAIMPEVVQRLFHAPRVSFGQWLITLCETHDSGYGPKVSGTKKTAIPAIRAALEPVMLRRTKQDVLPDLKAPQFFDTAISQSVPESWDEELQQKLEHAGWDGSDETLIGALRLLSATEPSISRQRKMLGETKVIPAAKFIDEYLRNAPADQKVLVFAHHTEVIDELHKRLKAFDPAVIDGRVSVGPARDAQELKFQKDPKCRVFIGQTLAAGTSITLTAGSTVFMVEPDWVPSNNEQAISRAHRQGQQNDVFVYWLAAPGTLDHRITNVIRRKTKDLAMTMGDKAA